MATSPRTMSTRAGSAPYARPAGTGSTMPTTIAAAGTARTGARSDRALDSRPAEADRRHRLPPRGTPAARSDSQPRLCAKSERLTHAGYVCAVLPRSDDVRRPDPSGSSGRTPRRIDGPGSVRQRPGVTECARARSWHGPGSGPAARTTTGVRGRIDDGGPREERRPGRLERPRSRTCPRSQSGKRKQSGIERG